jgi:hypothetical protein
LLSWAKFSVNWEELYLRIITKIASNYLNKKHEQI